MLEIYFLYRIIKALKQRFFPAPKPVLPRPNSGRLAPFDDVLLVEPPARRGPPYENCQVCSGAGYTDSVTPETCPKCFPTNIPVSA